jgi:hypothetical protein
MLKGRLASASSDDVGRNRPATSRLVKVAPVAMDGVVGFYERTIPDASCRVRQRELGAGRARVRVRVVRIPQPRAPVAMDRRFL